VDNYTGSLHSKTAHPLNSFKIVSENHQCRPPKLTIPEFDHGLVYTLNFSTPFKTSDNFSSVLTSITSVTGASSDIKPIYYDGALLANDGEFLAYGGLPLATVAVSIPDAGATFGYQRYWYGGADKKFEPTFLLNEEITAGISRYVGFGAGVSVPSENKGYYFGGMNSKSHGPVNYPSGNATTDPSTYSRDLISVDMTNQMQEVWTNKTINSIVPGRASPEMVWVPVGKNGVLVVIGGVVDPVFANASFSLTAEKMANSVSLFHSHTHIPQSNPSPSNSKAPPSSPPSPSTTSRPQPGTNKPPPASPKTPPGHKAAPSSPPPPTVQLTTSTTTAASTGSTSAPPSTTKSGSSPSRASLG
jgi:hypothetical protein